MSDDTPTAVLRTLLVTDLVDSTGLVARLGDERAFALSGRHDRLARDLLAVHHGTEIDKTDGFLLLFERPLDAVAYALAYHHALAALGAELGMSLAARAGAHLGEVFLRPNPPEDVARGAKPLEVEGLAKPLAARLMALAQGGQTLLTRGAFDVARRSAVGADLGTRDMRWVAHGAYLLKGVDEPVEVFEVGQPGAVPLAPPPDSEKARRVTGDQTIPGWRPAPGQDIPRRESWALVEKLGEGGFGEVWLARHKKTHDRVVFKFCFETERLRGLKREATLFRLLKEALGDRPDIARVRDWNFDEQPYFLESEYTAGGSLLDWAAAQGGVAAVPLATRLEIAAQAAEALAAAHSVGVLHKDLKPANILVTRGSDGTPQAQLTDFGIGLVTDASRLAQYGITASGMTEVQPGKGTTTSGTPKYMAPELLTGRPATVQADVYALGVILYQLAGADLERPLAPGWERDIGDDLLREDIAACVDGSPERRLASASELATRLRSLDTRHATREAARREQAALERARRRRRILAPAAAVLAVFAVAMGIQARRISLEAARAEREAAASREVSRFLVDLFELADSARQRGDTVTARELLDRGAERLERDLGTDRLTRARLGDTMGVVYLKLGMLGQARPLIESALATRRELLPADHPDLAASLDSAGLLALRQRQYGEAEKLLREALGIRQETLDRNAPEVVATLGHLALLFREQGRYDDAQPFERRAAALVGSGKQGASGSGPQPLETLALHRDIALPRDVVRLVGSGPSPGLALAVGRQGVYLVDLESGAPPAFAPLAADEEVVGNVGAGELAIRAGTRVLLRNLFPREGRVTERGLLDGIAREERLAVDPAGGTVVRVAAGGLRVQPLSSPGVPPVQIPSAGPAPRLVTVSRRFVAWVDGQERVHAHSVADGTELLVAREWEGRVNAIALEDFSGRLAVGGWFDEVAVFDLAAGRLLRRYALPGQTHGLLFLPDHPTLVVGKEGRLALLRDEPAPVAQIEAPAAAFLDLSWGANGLLARDAPGQKLQSFSYRSLPVEQRGAVAGVPVWAMAPSPDGSRLFLGTADGRLHRYDLATSTLATRAQHSQGVTSVVVLGKDVVTASDDKTIALWDADRLRVTARSKAHGYLVNFLHWEEATRTLWSASSDHSIKAWRLPDLVEQESFDPGGGSKAGLWIDSRRGLALVGTWERSWMELRRQGSSWKPTRTQAVASDGAYCVAVHPDAQVALIMGVRPSTLWLYDLADERAWELPSPARELGWISPIGASSMAVVSTNAVFAYTFARRDGGIDYELTAGLSTDLGELGIVATLPGGRKAAAANERGELFLVDTSALPRQVLGRGRVRP